MLKGTDPTTAWDKVLRPAIALKTPTESTQYYGGYIRKLFTKPVPSKPPSKFGGLPCMPDDMKWPTAREHPMIFVAQFDMSEVKLHYVCM